MKYSIDVNHDKKTISGWAVSNDLESLNNPQVLLTRVGRNPVFVYFGIFRGDLKNKKLHPDGNCGFRIPFGDVGIRTGDIFRIIISAENEKTVGRTFVAGNREDYISQFNKLEYERDDFSIMQPSVHELMADNSDLIVLKQLIVRLRRFSRAKNWRGSFIGVGYEHHKDDYDVFRKFVLDARYALFSCLPIRYVWSIIDTLADFGVQNERSSWWSISNMLATERMAQTIYCIGEFNEFDESIANKQIKYWGGMASNHLGRDDSFDIFLTRSITCLQEFPEAYSYYRTVMLSMMDEGMKSIWGMNVEKSQYFSQAWDFYKNKFLKENSKEAAYLDSLKLN